MLEYLYLDVKVRSPAEVSFFSTFSSTFNFFIILAAKYLKHYYLNFALKIADLTDLKLAEERAALGRIRTTTLIKDIRTSIELLLSIKNDQQT